MSRNPCHSGPKLPCLTPPLVTRGRSTGVLLEILAEEGLGREIEMVGDFLDAHAGIFQQGLGFEDDRFVDPPCGGLAADLLDRGREVFGRDVELPGVETA